MFFGEEFGDIRYVFAGRDDDGDDTAADFGSLKSFEESFHPEYFDRVVIFVEFLHCLERKYKVE